MAAKKNDCKEVIYEGLAHQLAALDGPEVHKAMRLIGGTARYVQLLCDFAARHGGDNAQLATLLADKRQEAARNLAHGLKGAAGSLTLRAAYISASLLVT